MILTYVYEYLTSRLVPNIYMEHGFHVYMGDRLTGSGSSLRLMEKERLQII